uniref:Uncharacterized protein n=1 Tax=Chromera velia CCMP2878 TaxID=1169474 RepID=A0A0G4GVS3_9ALVE|eukprot:Cvel_23593.t1-p1 / transcript=Cvel_23593.t1 / gene=Cvel_23593 / organism=Chromera_velia_CCMP2878 / gene_product=hypothetical protein / transcript_product=hypothetical protein / location=Cvel_scaffold2450:6540-8701(+) / protein_length=222 / sequence_SO=supercontig / SO=protein_coding / is_pseudo=false
MPPKAKPTAAKAKAKAASPAKPAAKAKAAAKAGAKAAPKASASAKDLSPASTAASPTSPPPPPKEPVLGKVKVKYNHYNKEFPIRDGELDFKDVDEEYFLSSVFSEKAKITLLNKAPPEGGKAEMEKYPDKNVWKGLEDGGNYEMLMEEDEEVENAQPKTVYVASGNDKMAAMRKNMDSDGFGGTDGASCSCIEGNPCAQPYNCKDWNNRFEVAKKNGWKGF